MIDYLEDLLEEETAVALTGGMLAPVGRRSVPAWEEDEETMGDRQGTWETDPRAVPGKPEEGGGRAGRPSWADQVGAPGTGGAALLTALTRAAQTAGMVRQQGRPLTVALAGEVPRGGDMDLEAMDRAVQRDARRYDGGFPLY